MSDQSKRYEYKHVECPQHDQLVNIATNDHSRFFWDLHQTQTVVTKSSHLESGAFSDSIYSVVQTEQTERFVALDFKRPFDTPNLDKVRKIESRYFQICSELASLGASPLNNYTMPTRISAIEGIIKAFFDLKFWLWGATLGYIRNITKVGLIGALFIPYGYFRLKDSELKEKTERASTLTNELQSLIENNKALLCC